MSLYPQLSQYTIDQLMDAFRQTPPDGREYAYSYYSEVAQQLVASEAGKDFLWQEAAHADSDRLRAIVFGLTYAAEQSSLITQPETDEYAELRNWLLANLNQSDPLIVAEAIDSLTRISDKRASRQVAALSQHASPYVRGSTLRYEARLFPDQALPTLINALQDPHFIVREGAADELAELGVPDAVRYLERLLRDPHPDVRQAAQSAIESLQN